MEGEECRVPDDPVRALEGMVARVAQRYFLPGGEQADLVQEGRLAVWLASQYYDPSRGVPFLPFALRCVEARLNGAVTDARCRKHLVLTERTEDGGRDDAPGPEWERFAAPEADDPGVTLLRGENARAMRRTLQSIGSDFEWRVVEPYLAGTSLPEAARLLGCRVEAAKNAWKRFRRKARHDPRLISLVFPSGEGCPES